MNDQSAAYYPAPPVLRFAAKVISYIFHPLFIPTYVYLLLTWLYPHQFSGMLANDAMFRTLVVFINTAFFPAVAVFLLWRLKFIDSIFLKTQKERIAPYMIVMIFYWWLWYLSKNFTDQPFALRVFFLGVFLSTPVALIANNFFKISMHAIGVGAAAAFVTILAFTGGTHIGAVMSIAWLIAGLVCTARFLASDHTNGDVYSGLLLGVITQAIAAWVTF
ncbi:MAG TPA: hypothetical protein VF145_09300 [Chitinophagaceae bacterium]